jgi:prolipoprotein diacylglyceryl transferase
LGLIIVLILFSRKTKRPILYTIDLIAIAAPLAGGFIRLANLMNSEIIGIPTKKPWGFIFARVDAIPRHPTQLYEAFSYFFIFFVLATLYKIRRNQLKNGVFFGLSLALIFSARFIIEFFKERQVSFEEHMTFDMGQLLSIPYIVIGIGFVVYGLRKTRKQSPLGLLC